MSRVVALLAPRGRADPIAGTAGEASLAIDVALRRVTGCAVMGKKWLLFAVSVVLIALAGAGAFFLYPRSRPQYCWLVFGPKATTRVLLRVDGPAITIDRGSNGKFGGKGQRFDRLEDCKDVVIADTDGKSSYVITEMADLHIALPEEFLEIRVRTRGPLEYPQCCLIKLAYQPQTAPTAHFHGALTIAAKRWKLEGKTIVSESALPSGLDRSDKPTELFATICTVTGEHSWMAICSAGDKKRQGSPFPQGVHPCVDVEFPPKKPGDPPIKKRYPLDKFC